MIPQIANHRSIRRYRPEPVPETVLGELLQAASRASTCGNMQLYSLVVTTDPDLLRELSACHFGQVEAMGAPMLVTVCADIHRFSAWCRMRGAEPCYDNFVWMMNGTIDALLAAENLALEAEAQGLGYCILGTTLYNAADIARILRLPRGVLPVTTLTLGYPAEQPPLTDRLPVEAIVHRERYEEYAPDRLAALWAEREASEETRRLLEENGAENLARIFTERRYPAADNVAFSRRFFDALVRQGFFNQ